MKKLILLFFIASSIFLYSQKTTTKLGVFTSLDANIGFDLGSMIRNSKAKTDYEKSKLPPGKYNYGFSVLAGYQPFNWFSVSGGLRYSYIDPNFHLIYYKVQPNFYINDPESDDLVYLFANFGNKINHTAAKNAGFVGIGIGAIEPLSKRFGHQFQVSLDDQIIDGESSVFIGISYGIILFSNKNL